MKSNFSRLYILFAVIFSVGILFSGCVDENDDEIVASQLNSVFTTTTNSNGVYSTPSHEYMLDDLLNINPVWDDVRDIRLRDSWINIKGDFYIGDEIDLTLTVPGVGSFFFPKFKVKQPLNRITLDDSSDPGYFDFMAEVMRELTMRGRIIMYVEGRSNASGLGLVIEVNNDLDVLVRGY